MYKKSPINQVPDFTIQKEKVVKSPIQQTPGFSIQQEKVKPDLTSKIFTGDAEDMPSITEQQSKQANVSLSTATGDTDLTIPKKDETGKSDSAVDIAKQQMDEDKKLAHGFFKPLQRAYANTDRPGWKKRYLKRLNRKEKKYGLPLTQDDGSFNKGDGSLSRPISQTGETSTDKKTREQYKQQLDQMQTVSGSSDLSPRGSEEVMKAFNPREGLTDFPLLPFHDKLSEKFKQDALGTQLQQQIQNDPMLQDDSKPEYEYLPPSRKQAEDRVYEELMRASNSPIKNTKPSFFSEMNLKKKRTGFK
jgi:hypothetical protein